MSRLAAAMVSVYADSFTPVPVESVVLGTVLERVKDGTYRAQVRRLRHLLQVKGKAAYDTAKRSSVAFTPAGVFAKRANAHLVTPSGCLNFDFDGVANCAEAKARLAADPCVVYVFDSPSATGLKAGVWASGIVDAATYQFAWATVLVYFQHNYPDLAVANDNACKDIARLCFMSWDPEAFLNPAPQCFVVPTYAPPPEDAALPRVDTPDYATISTALAAIPEYDNYDCWLRVGMALHSVAMPWGRGLWDSWSAQSAKFDPRSQQQKWQSFTHERNGQAMIHIGTILSLAHAHGWRRQVYVNDTTNDAPELPSDTDDSPPESPPKAPWPTMSKEAYDGLAGTIVQALEPYTEADPVAVLLTLLVGMGNMVGDHLYAVVQHDRHPPRLNAVLVGETSKGRKGTGWSTPRYLLSQVDPAWAAHRIKSGLSSGEGLIYNVRDPLWKQEPIKEKGRVVAYQDVLADAGESDKRLLIVEGEFCGALTVMAREGNILSTVLRQAWDDGNLSPLTRNNPIKASGAHISILGHITQQELLARLDDTHKANGYANRFLWALVKRSKALPEGTAAPPEVLDPLIKDLSTVFTFTTSHTAPLVRDEDARAVWAAVYEPLSAGKPGLLGAIIGRAEAQVLRLSVLYALLDRSPEIRVPHIKASLAVWQYCEDSARIIFGERLGDPTADRILEALRAAGRKGMTDNDLYELFGRNKSANDRARALNMLVSLGLAKSDKEESGGRPRTVWRAMW